MSPQQANAGSARCMVPCTSVTKRWHRSRTSSMVPFRKVEVDMCCCLCRSCPATGAVMRRVAASAVAALQQEL
eukprot:151325-Chlamydomonas_euryale.AAC.17